MSNLYLLPALLDPDGRDHIPEVVTNNIRDTRIFIVERLRTARRFIKTLLPEFPIDDALFIELDKHDFTQSLAEINSVMTKKANIAFLSEAGSPCVADPGARIVNLARDAGYTICPASGPASIILGLMASGMNGQSFTFHGYLPIKEGPLRDRLNEISNEVKKKKSTQIFIETPYRNVKLVQQIIKNVDPNLYLSVAINLNGSNEKVITKRISQWSPEWLEKSPAIFCIGQLET